MTSPFETKPGGFITNVGAKMVGDGPPLPAKAMYLQGYALRWDTPIRQGKNNFMFFAKDSIPSPMTGEPKRLHFDHDESLTIATTQDGLLLRRDDYGLAMRWLIRDTAAGRRVAETVKNRERDGLSVGVTIERSVTGSESGFDIRYVTQARLSEISLVPKGACPPAYCTLVDVVNAGSLEEDCASLRILADGTYVGVVRALRALLDK